MERFAVPYSHSHTDLYKYHRRSACTINMAPTPHTSCRKGKRVVIRLKDGTRMTGKFVERKGRFVYLDSGRIEAGKIKAFSIAR